MGSLGILEQFLPKSFLLHSVRALRLITCRRDLKASTGAREPDLLQFSG